MSDTIVIRDRLLHRIFSDETRYTFTVNQITNEYSKISSLGPNTIKLRNKVYRLVYKLYNLGWLQKRESKSKSENVYQKTKLFSSNSLLTNERTESDNFIQNKLKKRLSEYHIELRVSVAEADEYKKIFEEFPQLKKSLESEYKVVHARNSEYLGKVTALTNILKQMGGSSDITA